MAPFSVELLYIVTVLALLLFNSVFLVLIMSVRTDRLKKCTESPRGEYFYPG